jgi:hypothetical protein
MVLVNVMEIAGFKYRIALGDCCDIELAKNQQAVNLDRKGIQVRSSLLNP